MGDNGKITHMKRGEPGWEEHKACTSKIRHEEQPTDHAGWMRTYRCRFCGGWHLTSKPRTGTKKHEQAARDAEKRDIGKKMERS